MLNAVIYRQSLKNMLIQSSGGLQWKQEGCDVEDWNEKVLGSSGKKPRT